MGKNSLGMKQYIDRLESGNRQLMSKLGNNSKVFFQVKVWEAQGFIDGGVRKWASVKNKPPGQKILVRTGRLRRSGSSRVVNSRRAVVEFNTTYATYVNETRQFIGNSRTLDGENEKIIEAHIGKILK